MSRTENQKPSAALVTPIRFLIAGGMAAVVNFCVRIALSIYLSYPIAIVLAYAIGMATAFVLNRKFVFQAATNRLGNQITWFVVINLLAVVQTLAVSLLLARILLPAFHFTWHIEEIAHAVGIAVPIFTSYLGHKHLTFRSDVVGTDE